jgi:hypothetical protein
MRIPSKRIVFVMAALVCGWASPLAAGKELKDGGAVLRAMHDCYMNDWYETLTFQQDSITHNADGTDKPEVWYERLMVPGNLRIDIGKLRASRTRERGCWRRMAR